MSAHWSDDYLSRPYSEANCAELCVDVNREVFHREIGIPTRRARCEIMDLADTYAVRVDSPSDGDAVVMLVGDYDEATRLTVRPRWHIGVAAIINAEPWCLHAMRNAGLTVRHRVRDLWRVGLTFDGYWHWK
jgi:hypothetical protein